MQIGRVRNDFQVRLDFDVGVFEHLIDNIQPLITAEYEKVEKVFKDEIEKLESEEEKRTHEEYYFDLSLDEEKDSMIRLFKDAIVLIMQSYYEKKLKELEKISQKYSEVKGSFGESAVAKSIRNIIRNLKIKDCNEDIIAGDIKRKFTTKRNVIAHEFVQDNECTKEIVTDEFLKYSLKQIHSVLDGFAVRMNRKEIDKK